MDIPVLNIIDTVKGVYTPLYTTGPMARCKSNMCTQCAICLQPKPREHYKLSHVHTSFPKMIPPGGYYEMVQYKETGDVMYYMYCPSYI